MTTKQPLNQILYGPPGTGKTYNTIYKALDILEPTNLTIGDSEDFYSWSELENGNIEISKINKWKREKEYEDSKSIREIALGLFNKYKEEGRIVMTTFHQAMSYEDFVEGIKPITKDKEGKSLNKMVYEDKDGLFKNICSKAETTFETVLETFKKLHPQGNTFDILKNLNFQYDDEVGFTFGEQGERKLKLSIFKKILESNNVYNSRDVLYCSNNELGSEGLKSYYFTFYRELTKIRKELQKKHILIIDEINRGNIANIFGELITLIEDDKRTTKWDENNKTYESNPEGVKVKLPYSGHEFGVPGNLYIIGTMNTADRSVEALDSALRRRFSFTEMMPKPELLENVEILGVKRADGENANLADLLYTINKRIEILKDREHQIGHSYFMKFVNKEKVKAEELREVFYNKIIPLLQEYFYGDYESILKVLSSEFIIKEETKDDNNKPVDFFGNISNNAAIDKPTDLPYTINTVKEGKFAEAINSLKLVKYPIDKQEAASTQSSTGQTNAQ